MLPKRPKPKLALVEKRLVEEAVPAKELVVVAPVATREVVKNVVEVLFVVVALIPVKFWKVEDPVERRFEAVTEPKVELPAVRTVAKRLVELAVVAKSVVEVALVVVLLIPVKFWRVDEPVAKKLVVEAKEKRADVTESKPVLGLKVKPALPPRADVPVK